MSCNSIVPGDAYVSSHVHTKQRVGCVCACFLPLSYPLALSRSPFYTLQITSRVAVASSALALDPPVRWPRLWYRLLVSHLFALAFFPVSLRFRPPGLTFVSVALQVQGLLGAQVAYVPFLQCRASHSVYLGTASSSVGLGSARAFGSGVGFLLLSRSLSLALTLSFLAY